MIKKTNVNVQITLNQATAERLNFIVNDLNNKLSLNLTKSQAIAFLINDYGKEPTKQPKESKPRKAKTSLNYSAQILALKDKLSISYPHLAEILNIPLSTVKKYAYGTQQPSQENEEKILNILKRYGIK